jgi:uncharacterized lipoprotein YmbA
MSSAARRLGALTLAAALAACSSPDPVLYTIASEAGAVQAGGPRIVMVQGVSIARYLDRSQIVRSSEDYRLDVMSNDWWGEPLAAMLNRVLVAELSQRLPRSTVIGDAGAVSARPDATVEVNVERLDENAQGSLVLQAQAAVRATGHKEPLLRSFRFAVPPPKAGVPGEVAAISAAVARLADAIAPMVTMATVQG